MEPLLAENREMRAKMDTDTKSIQEKVDAPTEVNHKMLEAKLEAIQQKLEDNQESNEDEMGTVTVCRYRAPPLTRGRVCHLI
jgi:hypothetical protein